MNVETHLIHKQKDMKELEEQLAEVRKELSHELDQKATLSSKVKLLETHLHAHINEIGRTNEEMSEKETQLIRDRDLLEIDLTEMEEKYQISSQRCHQLETAVSNLEEDLGGCTQELRDARTTLDEVFAQLQASQGKLGDMQLELRGTQYERDSLQSRVQQLQQEHDKHISQLEQERDSALARANADLDGAHKLIAELQSSHNAYSEQVVQLRGSISDGS